MISSGITITRFCLWHSCSSYFSSHFLLLAQSTSRDRHSQKEWVHSRSYCSNNMTLLVTTRVLLLFLLGLRKRLHSSLTCLHYVPLSQDILSTGESCFSSSYTENKAFRGNEDVIFLQNHMAPLEDNSSFVINNLWMPLWNCSEIHYAHLQCPLSFHKSMSTSLST